MTEKDKKGYLEISEKYGLGFTMEDLDKMAEESDKLNRDVYETYRFLCSRRGVKPYGFDVFLRTMQSDFAEYMTMDMPVTNPWLQIIINVQEGKRFGEYEGELVEAGEEA